MSTPLLNALRRIVGDPHVRRGEAERYAYASDLWPRNQIWKLQGEPARHAPDVVVFPGSEQEVADVHRAALDAGVPLIPYGAGSGVCGGTVPVRGGVIMDVRRMNRVLGVDPYDRLATAEAGVIGMHLEETLNERGYTLGHFPSSILCSTFGGWIAARSAGQYSSRYGKIEDMVTSVRAVLPDGTIVDTEPSSAADLAPLLIGSEGTLGTIVRGTVRVFDRPEAQAFRGYRFRSLDSGVRAIRSVMQAGLRPMLLRLYDPFDTVLHASRDDHGGEARGGLPEVVRGLLGSAPVKSALSSVKSAGIALALGQAGILNGIGASISSACLLVIGFEGRQADVDRDMHAAQALLQDLGGADGGEGPGLRWLDHRYHVSFKQSALYATGAFVDTLEVGCTWARLLPVYHAVREAISPHALIMAHMSHAYAEGCSIYFTFAAHRRDPKALERHYDRVLSEAFGAVLREGGSISHHHGVGIGKRDQMAREHGAGLRLLYATKDALDPSALMNPGKVLPDRAVTQ